MQVDAITGQPHHITINKFVKQLVQIAAKGKQIVTHKLVITFSCISLCQSLAVITNFYQILHQNGTQKGTKDKNIAQVMQIDTITGQPGHVTTNKFVKQLQLPLSSLHLGEEIMDTLKTLQYQSHIPLYPGFNPVNLSDEVKIQAMKENKHKAQICTYQVCARVFWSCMDRRIGRWDDGLFQCDRIENDWILMHVWRSDRNIQWKGDDEWLWLPMGTFRAPGHLF